MTGSISFEQWHKANPELISLETCHNCNGSGLEPDSLNLCSYCSGSGSRDCTYNLYARDVQRDAERLTHWTESQLLARSAE